MSVKIKANLNNGGEIRRFEIHLKNSFASGYAQLLEKLIELFEIQEDFELKLGWKDQDGELITISTDEELLDAFEQATDNLLRLFIKAEPREPEPSYPAHPGIQCDNCSRTVTGVRFNCLECKDFDLCQVCHSRGCHSQHSFLILRRPGHLVSLGSGSHNNGPLRRGIPSFLSRASKRRFCAVPVALDNEAVGETIDSTTVDNSLEEVLRERLSRMGISDADVLTSIVSAAAAAADLEPADAMETTAASTESLPPTCEDQFVSGGFVVVSERSRDQIYPSLPPLPPAPTSVEPSACDAHLPQHIREAKAQMISMGFQDHNGWLTDMLVRENGDIPKCLDRVQRQTKN